MIQKVFNRYEKKYLLDQKTYEVFKKIRFAGDPSIVIDNIIYNYTQAYYYIKNI